MRTTIDLPEDLSRQALSIARATRRTLSATVVDLMRCGLGQGGPAEVTRSPSTGLPLARLGRPIGTEDVRSLDDEES